jgi:hypothetical protein
MMPPEAKDPRLDEFLSYLDEVLPVPVFVRRQLFYG